jgi:hypothetical protein
MKTSRQYGRAAKLGKSRIKNRNRNRASTLSYRFDFAAVCFFLATHQGGYRGRHRSHRRAASIANERYWLGSRREGLQWTAGELAPRKEGVEQAQAAKLLDMSAQDRATTSRDPYADPESTV